MTMQRDPSSGAARHLLPQGEKGSGASVKSLPQGEEGQMEDTSPSPLAGEGGSRRLTVEGFAKAQAKRLRKDMTDVERILWSALRNRKFEKFKFRRQVPVGRYIVDFVCFDRSVIVELDGSQHNDSKHDVSRDQWLKSQGFRVLRFWNVDVLQALDGTLLTILDALNEKSP